MLINDSPPENQMDGSEMKRFYTIAAVQAEPEGWSVRLDGRPVRTPAKAPLLLPTEALGAAIAAEWAAQGEKIIPDTMPLMTFAATAIDRVMPDPTAVAHEAAGYAGSDLLCYRAEQPVELSLRQAEAWDPILDWAARRYDVAFTVTRGLMPVVQPAGNAARFQALAAGFDPHTLTAVHVMTTGFGSFLLALAVIEGRLDAEAALATSRIDEEYQAELWGADEDAIKRHARLRAEMVAAQRFITLVRAA